jgi:hypothetical protein
MQPPRVSSHLYDLEGYDAMLCFIRYELYDGMTVWRNFTVQGALKRQENSKPNLIPVCSANR